jgi:hypothetical protein
MDTQESSPVAEHGPSGITSYIGSNLNQKRTPAAKSPVAGAGDSDYRMVILKLKHLAAYGALYQTKLPGCDIVQIVN